MLPHPRYDIIEQIAVGDFATVYRALDKELNREVAIKQIHPQFLADQRQLERYWQEAQLLASLEHPNIMTIYDIDRGRGWLILELMQGSLLDLSGGQPMDLDFLRVSLVCSLQALHFLHGNGIIHGDIKPSNLMMDKRNWVKLGDFGLAQRAASDQGSLLKGTTKYMAPERVSDQFGPVGPASDLYSLGFSMYELMCGDQFDALFPGLGHFGRDQQIAWMMWHAAPDRQAPEISRVLQGVPEDLQRVVQKLICKNPAERYATADQAIYDLKSGMGMVPPGPSEEELAAAAAEEEARQKHKRRKLLYAVAAVSIVLSLLMMFLPKSQPKPPQRKLAETKGVIQHLYPGKDPPRLVLDNRRTIMVRKNDQLLLNDLVAKLRELKEGDRLQVNVLKDDTGRKFQELRATRPSFTRGVITSVQKGYDTFVLRYKVGMGDEKDMIVRVPETVAITFNGADNFSGKPMTADDLLPGDRVAVHHDAEEKRRKATELAVTRVVSAKGTLGGVDLEQNTLTVDRSGDSTKKLTLPISNVCNTFINKRGFLENRPLTVGDLQTGDEVEVHYDTHVVKVLATRILRAEGLIRDLVASKKELQVMVEGDTEPTVFAVRDDCKPKLGSETVELSELQSTDRVKIVYDGLNPERPTALEIEATRPAERSRWAIVIGVQDYADRALTAVGHLGGDAELVRRTIVNRYRVAEDQALFLSNPIRADIEQQVVDFLKRLPPDSQLVVYYAGHAYVDSAGIPYLAPRDFVLLKTEMTGLPLEWFVRQVEESQAAEKLILLDTCHSGSDASLLRQPSSQELVAAMDRQTKGAIRRSTTILASCQAEQRGQVIDDRGQFAVALAAAYQGAADRDRDNRVAIPELFEFVTASLRSRTAGKQAPELLTPPEVKPARLSEVAQKAILEVALAFSEEDFDMAEVADLVLLAESAAPGQPEPGLLYGLAQVKAKEYDEAVSTFSQVWKNHPSNMFPLEGAVWALYRRSKFRTAVTPMKRIVDGVGKQRDSAGGLSPEARRLLPWLGRLREYAAIVAPQKSRPSEADFKRLDGAVVASGTAAKSLYQQGRDDVTGRLRTIDQKIAAATDRELKSRLVIARPRLTNYVAFSVDAAVDRVLEGMKK